MLKIYLTGPESSGKTTLSQSLAKHYGCPWVPEYARQYLQEKGGIYQYEDLEEISKGQLDLENQFTRNAPSKLIVDTDQLVLYIWSLHKYGKLSIPIERRLKDQKGSFHLLCRPDLTWEEDPLRENPLDRDMLFENYKIALETFDLDYVIIQGEGKERGQNVVAKIDTFLHNK